MAGIKSKRNLGSGGGLSISILRRGAKHPRWLATLVLAPIFLPFATATGATWGLGLETSFANGNKFYDTFNESIDNLEFFEQPSGDVEGRASQKQLQRSWAGGSVAIPVHVNQSHTFGFRSGFFSYQATRLGIQIVNDNEEVTSTESLEIRQSALNLYLFYYFNIPIKEKWFYASFGGGAGVTGVNQTIEISTTQNTYSLQSQGVGTLSAMPEILLGFVLHEKLHLKVGLGFWVGFVNRPMELTGTKNGSSFSGAWAYGDNETLGISSDKNPAGYPFLNLNSSFFRINLEYRFF